jgi:uncharacterized protein (TIGR00304 family)
MVDLILAGVVLVLIGFGVMVAAMLSQAQKKGASVRGGGVVMVGPVPIIFGSDMKWASIAIVLAIILVLVTLLLNVV